MKQLLYLLTLVFFSSCVKDYKSTTATFIKNTTSHKIEIIPYTNGVVNNEYYKLIEAYQDLEVYSGNVYGKTLEPDFGTLLQPNDSIVIKFDDSVKITHLKFNSTIQTGHYILYDSNRSISNPSNYVKTIEKETKHYLRGNFRYTFTEQDYLDAKQ